MVSRIIPEAHHFLTQPDISIGANGNRRQRMDKRDVGLLFPMTAEGSLFLLVGLRYSQFLRLRIVAQLPAHPRECLPPPQT
jgi:hypothetical protein